MRLWVLWSLTLGCALAQTVDFSRNVQPILSKRCSGCHGASQQMSGLRLDDGGSVLRGGNSGPAVIPGKPAESKLLERVTSDKKGFAMPPVGPRLTPAEVATLRNWIESGAKAPVQASAAPRSTHWSFQPIAKPAPPAGAANAIDGFIRERLQRENIQPSPEASKNTLIRRASLDLTGLPPTPAEVAAFVNDQRPDAYERLIDRLLASPHYGEKWARHWLDLAHYADSDGYEKDQVRANAWRYRHWVIDALNRDLPYDKFTIEQLAGDLLPNATVDQRVATGFLRTTLTNREAGVDRAEARFEQLVSRTNTVSTTWLGLTMGCSQCHNHKFDPIKQKDYYAMMAYFEPVEEQEIEAPLPGESEPYMKAQADYRARRTALLNEYKVMPLFETWQARMRRAFDHQGEDLEWDFAITSFRAMFDQADKFLKRGIGTLRPHEQEALLDYFVANNGPDINNRDKATGESLKAARGKLNELAATLPNYSFASAMAQMTDAAPTHLHIGGDYKNLGEEVPPASPGFLPLASSAKPTRLDLAKWLVSPENPLTARVAVNRIWQELFGRGLVGTSEDFGTQGEKPTHPQLLDWLANDFVQNGWSMKSLQKKIVMSATYRQSSAVRPELEQKDPENTLLARQSRVRLPAELVRDEALLAAGLLNPSLGGRSIRPPQPAGVAELGYANSVKWKADTGPERYRRGLYIHYQRTTPYPLLSNFDAPDSTIACSRRRRSNSPLQSLNLLNDPVFFEAAQAFGGRAMKVQGSTGDRIEALFEMALARKPKPAERERLTRYLDQQLSSKATEADAWTGVARVLLNLDEFITRE